MASVRAVGGTDPLSLSRGWKDYFLCCFMRTSPSGAGLRGGTNPRGTTAGGGPLPSSGGIVDYGSSSKSEYVQVISRSADADDDDDYSDCDEKNTASSSSVRGEDGARKKSRSAGCTVSTSSESRQTTGKLTTTIERPLGSTPNHSTYGEGRIEEEDGELDAEDAEVHHQSSVTHRSVVAEERMVASAMMSVASVASVASVGAVGVAVSPAAADHETSSSSMVGELKRATSSSANDTFDSSHLFDTSDLHLDKSSSPWGSVRMTIAYNDTREQLNVTVHEARDIPSGERGGANQTQVRMLLLPARKVRQRTKVKSGENPQFEEILDFRVARDDVTSMGLRIRLYGCERFRRECLIGETIFSLSSINTDFVGSSSIHVTTNINLEPRNSLTHGDSLSDVSSLAASSECSSSTLSLQHGGTPELMIGLAYNATTGRMSVEVIKGSNFRNVATKRRPDTYVKMTLTAANGEEITSSKTSVRRGQANPLFKEMFVFQVAQFQLTNVSLLVSIFAQRSLKRKDTIGWFSLGNTSSSEEEQGHWSAMLSSKGEQVCRWHALLEP